MTEHKITLKERKHPRLWQSYKYWDELMGARKKHLLRKSAIERGASSYDIGFEQSAIDTFTDMMNKAAGEMRDEGELVGPIWDWLTSIKGIGKSGSTAAKLLALFDDISTFENVSQFWRYAGQAVIGGEAEHPISGEKLHYNAQLKSECWLLALSFVRQQTPPYVMYYYAEKERQQALHPDPICTKCGMLALKKGQSWCCPEHGKGRYVHFTPAHIDNRARRKMVKIFLQHFWLTWRKAEGLSVNMPYAHEKLGHTTYYVPTEEAAS